MYKPNIHSFRGIIIMNKTFEGLTFYFLFFILLIGLTITVTITMKSENTNDYMVVTIEEGDTIWKLREDLSDYHNLSFTDFVKWIEKNNQVNVEYIKPGHELIIPIKDTNRLNEINHYAMKGQ